MTLMASNVFAKGGDDVGNGGFAYKQSVKILKMATAALEDKIRNSTLKDLVDFPQRRIILQDTLRYEDLEKLSKKRQYRGGRELAMNYLVRPETVIVLKSYFEAFAGKTDTELEDASLEVQKRLLHEASHIWGYKEEDAEKFSIAFLKNANEERPEPPTPVENRPSNDIKIKSFCSCLNGKSDVINDCDQFCANAPMSNRPVLFVETILGAETATHPKLGSLYKWCTTQLSGDSTTPQCMLNATDGTNEVMIPVTIKPTSNIFQADISTLKKNTTYLLKLVEAKTGTNAQSQEFQLRRKIQTFPGEELGALKVSPISQFTCFNFGGKTAPNGEVHRTNYVRSYYYYPVNETPAPLPPIPGNGVSLFVCHDEQMYPGNDSVEYPRLEELPQHLAGWDKTDTRFMRSSYGKMQINSLIEQKLLEEYNINANIDLFRLLSYKTPTSKNSFPLAYLLIPFSSPTSGKSVCPNETDYNSSNPLMNILGEFMTETEGIYLAEKEGETLGDSMVVYGTMLVRETTLLNYGFYIQNGLKIKATPSDMHTKTIFYYWPASSMMDPLVQGNRKLFTVKHPDRLNGNVPEGIPTDIYTTDKRLGCIPKL